MTEKILFSFADLSVKDKAAKIAVKYFKKAGLEVSSQDVLPKVRRTSGISYREMKLAFSDSQTVLFRIKQSGDIYQILFNGRLIPIKNQDNHVEAIAEIASKLLANRSKFQAKLSKAKVKAPPSIKTAAPKIRQSLIAKRDGLVEAISAIKEELKTVLAA